MGNPPSKKFVKTVRFYLLRIEDICATLVDTKDNCTWEVHNVSSKTKFYIVAADALPEIFIKVAEAKRMLQTGEAATVGGATRKVGISRSAFYKYKDSVQPFNNMKAGHIITFYAMLKDNPGVLSSILSIFASSGANILTINQSIPTNGCAAVTISAETSEMEISLEDLIGRASAAAGVVKFEILAG